MVKILSKGEQRTMTREEINSVYDGKWIFMINVSLNPFVATPIIIADDWWEDHESGIYEQLKSDEKNGATMHLSLLKNQVDMLGLF